MSLPSSIAISSYSSPLISKRREKTIREVLSEVDFARADSVTNAHQAVVKMGVIDRFCDRAFHGRGKAEAEALDALATLIIHNRSGGQQLSQIDGSSPDIYTVNREHALASLAKLLSPTGTHALFASSAEGRGKFSDYLTHEDQSRLAKHARINCLVAPK